jgi:hypothetical protein
VLATDLDDEIGQVRDMVSDATPVKLHNVCEELGKKGMGPALDL